MKERITINAPNENSQNYQNLLKDYELLKSKYDNILFLLNLYLALPHKNYSMSHRSDLWETTFSL